MTRHFRPVAVGLLALFGAAALTFTSLAQAPHRAISAAAKVAEARARDLGPASAESEGISTERLSRLDAGMRQQVEGKKVAGLV